MSDIGSWTGAGVAPQVVSASVIYDRRLRVYFSEQMESNAAFILPANYVITVIGIGDPVSVISVDPGTGCTYADVITDVGFTPGTLNYRVTVSNVEDLAGNPIDPANDDADFNGVGVDGIIDNYVGLIEAIMSVIGEADNEIGGFVMTRTTAFIDVDDTVFQVETTLDWADSGVIAIDGIKYYYSAKTDMTFTGITRIEGGVSAPGAIIQHRVKSTVLDISGIQNALEKLRRSFLLAYAEDEDLNVIGRNLGVNRLPIFEDDDQFRAVIEALAYNPKGTYLGLELALDGLVGAGNYEIYEDLLQYPNTVFFKLAAVSLLETEAQGKAFINDLSWKDITGGSFDTLTLDAEPVSVTSVKLHDLGQLFDFRDTLPSAVTYEYFPGDTPAVGWVYAGSNAETSPYVVQNAGSHVHIYSGGGTTFYRMDELKGARIIPESHVDINWLIQIPSSATIDASIREQASVLIYDGAYVVGVGITSGGFGLFDPSGSGFLGATASLNTDQWYEVTIRKFQDNYVELWIDGEKITTVNYSLFTDTTTNHQVEFGSQGSAAAMRVDVRQLSISVHSTKDYWNARGTSGSVATANPKRFNDGISLLASGDVAKQLVITGSAVTNSFGGNNNGIFKIDSFVSSGIVELTGADKIDALTNSTYPKRITIPNEDFVYPDDLGKQITLSGSTLGNDGTYTIEKLLNPGTLTDLSTFDTSLETKTNVCEVQTATLVSETGLDWKLEPDFIDESSLSWELSDASFFTGAVITLRQGLWAASLLMQISENSVLSSQVLAESVILNYLVSESPLQFTYWPFYLADPFGLVQAYLDDITAAGVIPEYTIL